MNLFSASEPQLCDALNRRHSPRDDTLDHPPAAYITHVVAPLGGDLLLDTEALHTLGVRRVAQVQTVRDSQVGGAPWRASRLGG